MQPHEFALWGTKSGRKNEERQRVLHVDVLLSTLIWRPLGDLNPRRRRERPLSWAGLDEGDTCIYRSLGGRLRFCRMAGLQGFEP